MPFVNAGRWLIQCEYCHSAVPAAPDALVVCLECGGGGWRRIAFPEDTGAIEGALLRLPGFRLASPVRHWLQHETMADLEAKITRANELLAQGVKYIRALSIGTPRIWSVGEILSATNMNTFISDIEDDLRGANGVTEFEDSLRILNGSGGRFFGLPGGTTQQRPSSPAVGSMRYNTSQGAIDFRRQGIGGRCLAKGLLPETTSGPMGMWGLMLGS